MDDRQTILNPLQASKKLGAMVNGDAIKAMKADEEELDEDLFPHNHLTSLMMHDGTVIHIDKDLQDQSTPYHVEIKPPTAPMISKNFVMFKDAIAYIHQMFQKVEDKTGMNMDELKGSLIRAVVRNEIKLLMGR